MYNTEVGVSVAPCFEVMLIKASPGPTSEQLALTLQLTNPVRFGKSFFFFGLQAETFSYYFDASNFFLIIFSALIF